MKKIIIANWKMKLPYADSLKLARSCRRLEAVICPDHLSLAAVAGAIKGGRVRLGAQDCAPEERAALTGEVSPADLRKLGVRHVILGHSERRQQLHENSIIINRKIQAALAAGLIPVLCVGEKAEVKRAGITAEYIGDELRRALKGIKIASPHDLLIAYEPIWAISTVRKAKPLAPAAAAQMHAFIRREAKKILSREVRILYGGSVRSENAPAFLAEKEIDGLLVGAASLDYSEFKAICS